MCGGGYSPPPAPPQPWGQTEEGIRWAAAQEEARREREQTERRNRFNTGLENALTGARQRARSAFEGAGVNPDDFAALIDQELSGRRSLIPDLAENPGSFFSDDIGAALLGRATQQQQTQFRNQLQGGRFGTGYDRTAFGDTTDDAIINTILGEQQGEAQAALDRARQRGTLNDVGYNAGQRRIAEIRSRAAGQAQALGGAVLDRYRGQLREIGDNAFGSVNAHRVGQSFNPQQFFDQFDQTREQLSGQLEGDVRSAANIPFFDVGEIIGAGGRAQGPTSGPNGSSTIGEVLAQRNNRRTNNRGLGAQGAF